MTQIHLPDPSSWGGALHLPSVGVICAEGADAASFLHGQLSQDVNGQQADQARLAAYCSVKGRMLASMLTLRPQPELFCLLTDKAVLPGLLKRLSMFVMRAKAKLRDASDELSVLGLAGQSALTALGDGAAALAPWQVMAHNQGQLLRLPDVQGLPRWQWVGPAASAPALLASLPALPADAWAWLDVMGGIPRIEALTVDQFVPQMVNFELVGGVNFKKGCYPGQEVVARSQYRGTTKRRAFIVHSSQPLQAGQEVFSEADPGQPAGLVINVAPMPTVAAGAHSALVELKLQAAATPLFAGGLAGPRLSLGTLPYELPSAESGKEPNP